MAEERSWHLVSYDIREPKRWRRVYKLLKGYGRSVQYSVFRIRGTALTIERMRWELERLLEPEDELLVIPLCKRCAERISVRSTEGSWPEEEPPFLIVGE
jgi:CRISPR-associated protein Cas2